MSNDQNSPLQALSHIISNGIQALEGFYGSKGSSVPSLNSAYNVSQDPLYGGSAIPSPDAFAVQMAARSIIDAAHQLIAIVSPPAELIQLSAASFYVSSALAVVERANVANVVIGAGDKGMPIEEISTLCGDIDAIYLGRVLRFLCSRHIFKEVKPNTFAINKLSSLLVKTELVKNPLADPITQYDNCAPPAWVGHITGESLSGAPFVAPFILGKHKKVDSPWALANNTSLNIWQWYEEPAHELEGRRFVHAMKGIDQRWPINTYTEAYPWDSLGPNDIAVDVGGGAGRVSLILHKAFPTLHLVIQDLPKTVAEAKPFWETEAPGALESGKVRLKVHDFFKPQEDDCKGAAVYFMRTILHDWSQDKATEIMKALRESASPKTKVIVFDMIIPYACEAPPPPPGAEQEGAGAIGLPPTPYPLLPNASLLWFSTVVDLQMMNLMNGMERTISDFEELRKRSGWKVEQVKPGPLSVIVYVPN